MKVATMSRMGRSLLLGAAMIGGASAAFGQAQGGIFDKIEPSLRDRMFMRLNYIHANVKTTSGDAYDVTGPVVGPNDIGQYLGAGSGYVSMFTKGNVYATANRIPAGQYTTVQGSLTSALDADLANGGCAYTSTVGLGTPCGVRARSSATAGTPAISVGFFLDEAQNWVAEAFVLALPLKADIEGQGNNQIDGKKIMSTKLLPPTAVFGRYFGDRDARVRPFIGLGGSYAIFFDTKATQTFNEYQGGKTTVSVKNALGFGPFFGVKAQLDDQWHVSLNVGKLSYRTEATLVTHNTKITAESGVINDYGMQTTYANTTAVQGTLGNLPIWVAPAGGGAPQVAGYAVGSNIAPLTALMCDLARAKYGNNECNHGTFVRKQKTKLDNTLFMVSVGRSF